MEMTAASSVRRITVATAVAILVAALLWKFGPLIRNFIEARLGLVFTVFSVGLIGGFVAIKFLF